MFQISYHRLKGFLLWHHKMGMWFVIVLFCTATTDSNFHFGKQWSKREFPLAHKQTSVSCTIQKYRSIVFAKNSESLLFDVKIRMKAKLS